MGSMWCSGDCRARSSGPRWPCWLLYEARDPAARREQGDGQTLPTFRRNLVYPRHVQIWGGGQKRWNLQNIQRTARDGSKSSSSSAYRHRPAAPLCSRAWSLNMGDNDAEINPQWTGPAEHIFPSLTTGAGFLTEEARQTEVTPKKLLLVHSSCTWNFMVAVLIQSMSRWISHGGKPSWCCSKKWTRTHPPQWFFSGQWVNQDVQPYNSLNPWEKQILKKKKSF